MPGESTSAPQQNGRLYHAFISYSHSADGQLAPALQRALHQFAKPLFKVRALRVFRDKESLSANPALWPAIEKALRASEYFLLLASPGAARSPWVVREVQWWMANRSADKQLIVLTEGELVWNTATKDFDWDKTTALPRAIAGRFSDEPLWVDLRWAKNASDLSLRHSQFRAAVLDLAAPLHSRPKEELDSEDVRQHRRTTRLRRGAIAVLVALTVTAITLAMYAVRQRDEATRQRDFALSRQTAAQALRVVDASLDTALLLAVEASRRADTYDARNALLTTLLREPSLGFLLPGHPTHVTAAAFSPDGKVIVSGSDDGVVMFWDAGSRQSLGSPVAAHQQGVTALVFSADGRLLASAGRDGSVRLWDASARQPLGGPLSGHRDSVAALAFSPDGRTLASGDSSVIRLWNVNSRTMDGDSLQSKHRVITALAFDAAGATLASADGAGTVVVWNLMTPERMSTAFYEGTFFVRALKFTPAGRAIAFGFSGGNLIRWDVGQGQPTAHPISASGGSKVTSLDTRAAALSQSSNVIAVANPGGEIMVVDVVDAEHRQPLTAKAKLMNLKPRNGVLTVALSADGEQMVSGYRGGTLAVWNATEQHPLARPLPGGHQRDVSALAFAADGKTLVSASDDGTLILWNSEAGQPLAAPLDAHKAGILSVAISRNGQSMASGDYEGNVIIWDVAARRPRGTPLSGHRGSRVNGMAFSPDGSLLATAGGDGRLILWDMSTLQPSGSFPESPQKGIAAVAFAPDGQTLASGGGDGTVMLWDVATRRALGAPIAAHGESPASHLAFRGDGEAVVSVGGGYLNVWTLVDGRTLGRPLALDPIDLERRQGLGGGLAWSPDGMLIVTGGNNRLVLWDAASGQPLERVLFGWRGSSTKLALSPDGRVVAASHGEGLVLWDVDLASWQQRACSVVRRNLTIAEWNTFIGQELPYRSTCDGFASSP